MAQDMSLSNISVDSSNKIGLYGEDLANLTGAMTQIMDTALVTQASVAQSNQNALNMMASKNAEAQAVAFNNATQANAQQMKGLQNILIYGGLVLAGLFVLVKVLKK